MPTELIQILGAGGHGRVVLDALLSQGVPTGNIRVRDDNPTLAGTWLLGCEVVAPMMASEPPLGQVHAAVGDARVREVLLQTSGCLPAAWLTVIHPRACVSAAASIGAGGFVAAQAVVGPGARLGQGVIVNHGGVVDHDCEIGDFCHIAPLASLGGAVTIGARAFVGAGVRVLPRVNIGADAVIGAGAVVLSDVPAGQTWVGVPARPVP